MICLAGAVVAGLAACDPVGGLNSASIAVTTDRTGTRALEHEGVDVQWLSCTARTGGGASAAARAGSSTAVTSRVADVDCNGRTKDGQDISLNGMVDREVEGRCVSGDMTAKAGGKTVFRATMLGNCDAAPSPSVPSRPPAGGSGEGVRPTATVTVTVTAYPQGK
ncbi:hypothetical protein [Streptomyces brevispora]|uniref:Lipoprotein n=1 Tax=Streptomyces brevispora TaxID=887462 RepID=A0ABZ1G7K0_9ACTN|nr:hypothetical protein [Streptomyces brevispora]WSC15879.1 hypothetical protein OIE64_25615 [Streptomyces brevispora]